MQITGSLAMKSGAVLLAAGGAGIAGWKISSNKPEKEKEKEKEKTVTSKYLTDIGRILASTDEEWESLKTFYSKESSEHPISGIAKTGITKETIRDWCTAELTKPVKEQTKSHLLLVESWCSKPQKLSEHLTDIRRTKLDTSGGNDSQIWTSYETEYKKSENKQKIQKKENGENEWQDFDNSQATVKILQDWCKGQEDYHFKYKGDALFERYVKWCSK